MKRRQAKKAESLLYRDNSKTEQLSYRLVQLAPAATKGPASLDEKTRSVAVVAATENPVRVFDPERWEVIDEVLLMSGCRIPGARQIPLLDSHPWQYKNPTTADVLGSGRDLQVDGSQLLARAYYSSVAPAEDAWTKTKEGHLTDYSLGYRVLKAEWVPEGESTVIQGRTFTGPVKVATEWIPRELSTTPIGADEQAKARSQINPTQHKEDKAMNEKLRKFLEARGLAKDAPEDQAWAFLEKMELPAAPAAAGRKDPDPVPQPAAATAGKTEDEVRMEAVRAEQSRILEIRAMADLFDYDQDKALAELIKSNKPLDEARKIIMDHVVSSKSKATKSGPGFHADTTLIVDERDKFRAAAQDALFMRGGIAIEKPAAGAMDLRGYTLVEMARTCLRLANLPINGMPLEMVGRALTSSDFPILLAATANKFLFAGFEAAQETYLVWVDDSGIVNDFKAHTLNQAGETDDLDEIPDHGEYKYGSRSEAKETYQIATYGKLFAITRQTIINDDLGALTDIPKRHGEAASRKIGDLPYAVLVANAAMGDGKALFHADHGNLAGSGGAVGSATIAAAEEAMLLQKDIGGKRRLNIQPQFFIGPVKIKGTAEIFFLSERFSDNNTPATDSTFASTRKNPYFGPYFTRVYEPRLDDASATAWYLLGPKGKTVKLFFLNGNKAPYMEVKQGWTVDGVEYKVRIDAVAKALSWKGIYKNAGA